MEPMLLPSSETVSEPESSSDSPQDVAARFVNGFFTALCYA